MMKKLLVLALVLGIAGMSMAGLKISVGGDKAYADNLTVMPSDIVILDIFSDTGIVPTGDFVLPNYALVVQASQGSIIVGDGTWGTRTVPGYANVDIDNAAVAQAGMPVPDGSEGVWGNLTIWSNEAAVLPMATIFDGIVFHCHGPENAVIQLWRIDESWGLGELLDEVVINQIPEPMTMLLLGLGGLFLRKK